MQEEASQLVGPGHHRDLLVPQKLDQGEHFLEGCRIQYADCTQGTNGRCLPPQGNIAGDFCSYDECATDAECTGGAVCLCGASLGTVGTDGTPTRTGNRCVKSGCRLDADCGAGGFCSPTYDTFCGPRNGVQGYDCHTPNDECTNDDQCTEGGAGYCAFQPTLGRWKCSYGFCAG